MAYGAGMNLNRLSVPQRVSAIAIVVVAVAAFLPWVSIFGISALGVEGDGVITLLLAIVGAVVLAVTTGVIGQAKSPGKLPRIVLLIMAAVVAIIAFADMNGAAAMGLYLTLFGGIAWVVGAVWELASTNEVARDGAPVEDA